MAKIKKTEVEEMLIDMFDRIGIQTPNNFNSILDFVYEHVSKNVDESSCFPFNEEDIAFAFKQWIELKK